MLTLPNMQHYKSRSQPALWTVRNSFFKPKVFHSCHISKPKALLKKKGLRNCKQWVKYRFLPHSQHTTFLLQRPTGQSHLEKLPMFILRIIRNTGYKYVQNLSKTQFLNVTVGVTHRTALV
jgi:hypothetical protein